MILLFPKQHMKECKMKNILILFVLLSVSLGAQSGTLKGNITDAETGKPLVGANLSIDKTNKGAATIDGGKYVINKLEEGNFSINVSYMGYHPLTVKDVKIKGNDVTELNLSLPRNSDFQMHEDLESFYLNELPADLKEKLSRIKDKNRTEYFRTLQEIYFEYILSKKSKSESQILELEIETKLIALDYKDNNSSKKELKEELIKKISRQFDLKQQLRLENLNQLSSKILEMEKSIEDSKINKEIYVHQRVNQLLGS
jgi:hypothetical protein